MTDQIIIKRRFNPVWAARAMTLVLGTCISLTGGSSYAQFTAQDFVTATNSGATASGGSSIAIGPVAMATALGSTSIGISSQANGEDSIAIGLLAIANGEDSIAIGNFAGASVNSSTALGQGSFAGGNQSTALGQSAQATDFNSTAVGQSAVASGSSSTAVGRNSLASGPNAVALGVGAQATAFQSTSLGMSSEASGFNATSVGALSEVVGVESTALGFLSEAAFNNSTAIGARAATTQANQVMIGTNTNTYTTPGISSAASTAAQSGSVEVVTSDASGNLATSDVASLGLASTGDINGLSNDINRNSEGVAMAMALSGVPTILPVGTNYAVSYNWGNFNRENAVALGGSARLAKNVFLNGGGAIGVDSGQGGGRAGMTVAW